MSTKNHLQSALWVALAAALGAAHPAPAAQTPATFTHAQYEGSAGPSRIGMALVAKDGAEVISGHYFTAENLTDIPLNGSITKGVVMLQADDGTGFSLRFKTNAARTDRPLDFNNTTGLQGTCTRAGKSQPVALSLLTAAESEVEKPERRRYEDATAMSDADYEAIIRAWQKAVLAGDRAAAARYTEFPLRVNARKHSRLIRTAKELSANWATIFTPAYLRALRRDMPHDMFMVEGLTMLGRGDAWFGDKGAFAVNIP